MSLDPRNIELSADQALELSQIAAETGKPWPVVFREALEAYRSHTAEQNGNSRGKSFLEAASKTGLIGCLHGGPPDLSSNPSYMEGFGENHG